jgi:hypothetical protein
MTAKTHPTKREALSKGRQASFFSQNARTLTVTGGLVLLGLVLYLIQMPHRSAPVHHEQQFFTVDDGKTWFADSATNIPPFEKDGQQAVLAHVYRSANGTEFVNYLERFKRDAQKGLENSSNTDASSNPHPDQSAIRDEYSGRQVKRPGDAKWVDVRDFPAASKIMAVKCPDGSTTAVPVEP